MDALIALEEAVARGLAQDVRRRTLHKAARAAYAAFAQRHPAWVAALFDEHFVLRHLRTTGGSLWFGLYWKGFLPITI
jgi:hypothetical protein